MKTYLLIAFACCLVCFPPLAAADDHSVDFDPKADFSKFKTFTIPKGKINAKDPELNTDLVEQRIEEAIRQQLLAKGLTEAKPADLQVHFRLGAANKTQITAYPAGWYGMGTRRVVSHYKEGTLVIDLTDRLAKAMVWHGIYRDDESKASKIRDKLPDHVKKLFEKYPPKP
jgi:hypothetical protein